MRRITLTSLAAVLAVGLALAPLAPAQQPPPTWQAGAAARHGQLAAGAHCPAAGAQAARPRSRSTRSSCRPDSRSACGPHGINNARAMAWGDKGTLFLGSRVAGNVYAVVDRGGQREVKVIAKGLNQPSGVAFRDGALYVAEISAPAEDARTSRTNLDNPPDAEGARHLSAASRTTTGGTWPSDRTASSTSTWARPATSACRPTPTPTSRASTRTARGFEYCAHGVRNSVGFDFHPVTKELYFTNHGRDWLGDDVAQRHASPRAAAGPELRLPVLPPGRHPRSRLRRGALVQRVRAAAAQDWARTWPATGIQFYTGSMFPAEYKNRAFLALRGSWNRTQKIGYRVMTVDAEARTRRAEVRGLRRGLAPGQTSPGAGPSTRSR